MTQQRSRCSAQPAQPTANDDDSTTTRRRSQDAAGPTQSSSHATAPCWRAYKQPSTCSSRAFRTVPPQELTDAAHKAARLTDTDAHLQIASRTYTIPLWYQSRVWDPDD